MHIATKHTKRKRVGPMIINEYLLTPQFSGALIEIDGAHGKMKCIKEDRIYLIINGRGEFSVDGEVSLVEKEDVVFVPMNTIYNFSGKMKLFLMCSPEYNPEDDVFLD